MKKIVISLFFSTLGCLSAFATDYAYTIGNTLNVRQSPSTQGKKLTSLPKGSVLSVLSSDGEWLKIQYYDFDVNFNIVKKDGYVAAKFVKTFGNDPIPASVLKRGFSAFGNDDIVGGLEFTVNGRSVNAQGAIYSAEMRSMGGSGLVDNFNTSVTYTDNRLGDCNGYPSVYDASQNLLYFGGYLWKTDK